MKALKLTDRRLTIVAIHSTSTRIERVRNKQAR